MTDTNPPGDFVERMFPEPVDYGIAEEERAVSNVRSGTDTPPEQAGNTKWYEGGGQVGDACAHRHRDLPAHAWPADPG